MLKNLLRYLDDKKILILGFGKEGVSTYKFIRKHFPDKKIYISDKKTTNEEIIKKDINVNINFGDNYLDNLKDFDIIMKSPGISFANINIDSFKDKIKSELELFLEYMDVKTIGVTGSKGKSTTSSLIYEILKKEKKETLLLGNIGIPVFDLIDDITKDTIVVLEMSSHQLEYMNVSPNISILLNIYEEHLDHYKSLKEYAEAKINIGRFQNKDDYFIYNVDNKIIKECINEIEDSSHIKYEVSFEGNISNNNSNKVYIKDNYIYINEEKIYNINEKRNLIGDHNLNNIMFVLTVSKILNLNMENVKETISNFKGLEHRMEYVGKYDDIIFYNDSIATIPEATINSIKGLKDVDTLIFGGMDRGISYDEFIDFLNTGVINNLICMPDTGYKIADKLKCSSNIYKVETLEEAVELSKKVTKKNRICLLSPAAASYGFFKNFVEKGNIYKELVKKIHV